jgi:hypothetical protein
VGKDHVLNAFSVDELMEQMLRIRSHIPFVLFLKYIFTHLCKMKEKRRESQKCVLHDELLLHTPRRFFVVGYFLQEEISCGLHALLYLVAVNARPHPNTFCFGFLKYRIRKNPLNLQFSEREKAMLPLEAHFGCQSNLIVCCCDSNF